MSGPEEKPPQTPLNRPPCSSVEVKFPERFVQDYYADKDQRNSRDKLRLIFEIATTSFVLIYTFITAFILYATIVNFRQDQRPYIWGISEGPKIIVPLGNDSNPQRITGKVVLVNFGKTPAQRVSATGKVFFGPNAIKNTYDWISSVPNPLPPTDGTEVRSQTVIPQGIPPRDTTGSWIFYSDQGVLTRDAQYIGAHLSSVVLSLRVQYFDVFGRRYWSDICYVSDVRGTYGDCDRHNEVH